MRQHWPVIKRLTKTNLTPDDMDEYTRPFWFNYFWEEAKEVWGQPSQTFITDLVTLLNLVFVLPDKWRLDGSNPQLFWTDQKPDEFQIPRGSGIQEFDLGLNEKLGMRLDKEWNGIPSTLMLSVLSELLAIGFRRVPGQPNNTLPTQDSSIDLARFSLTHTGTGREFKLGWRGDGRKVGDIRDAGGLINKSQSEYHGYARTIKMREPWHPFNLPANQSDYFYRRGKDDNCLYTTVSISTDFKTASTFPLLNNDYIRNLPATLPSEQDLRDGTALTKGIVMSREGSSSAFHRVTGKAAGQQQTTIRICDRQQLYLVVIEGTYFNTNAAQSTAQKFPEIAVKKIPETGVLACLSFVRVHHGLSYESSGCTVFHDPQRSVAPTIEACRRYAQLTSLTRTLYDAVSNEYDNAKRSMPFHVKWTPNEGEKVDPIKIGGVPFHIESVRNLKGGLLWEA